MSNSQSDVEGKKKSKLSLDTWAVIVALLAIVVIRLGLVHVPW